MGFNKDRGDSLNVANSQFAGQEKEAIVDLPFWKQPDMWQAAKELGKYLLTALVLLYLFFGYLKPLLYKIMGKETKKSKEEKALAALEAAEKNKKPVDEENDENADGTIVNISKDGEGQGAKSLSTYEINLTMARNLAASDPKIVANVIKTWINNE
jgi:flagellar M-ring protein FliF